VDRSAIGREACDQREKDIKMPEEILKKAPAREGERGAIEGLLRELKAER
jgi:hypothetical protein